MQTLCTSGVREGFLDYEGRVKLGFFFCYCSFLLMGCGGVVLSLCPKITCIKTPEVSCGCACECVFVYVWQLNLCLLEISEFFSFFPPEVFVTRFVNKSST